MGMDKMAIARRKCARGAVLTLLFGNPRAAGHAEDAGICAYAGDPQAANEIGSHIYYLADKAMSRSIWVTRFSASCRTRRGRRSSA